MSKPATPPAAASGRPHESFADLRVTLSVVLPSSTLTLDELARLEPGALLRLSRHVEAEVELVVNGATLAAGQIVSVGGRRAIVLSEIGA